MHNINYEATSIPNSNWTGNLKRNQHPNQFGPSSLAPKLTWNTRRSSKNGCNDDSGSSSKVSFGKGDSGRGSTSTTNGGVWIHSGKKTSASNSGSKSGSSGKYGSVW